MPDTSSMEPKDKAAFRAEAHAALDAALDHLEGRSDAPVWKAMPIAAQAVFQAPLPQKGQEHAVLDGIIRTSLLPYDVGNTHPRFFGWVHGSGTAQGIIPEIYAAAMNANLGGRDHGANYVERQVIEWCRTMFGFPDKAGGLIVSGTSMATVIAIKAARDKLGGLEVRKSGMVGTVGLVGYASSEAHSCVARAFDILGLGVNSLRKIPVDDDFRMDLTALHRAIAKDKAEGLQPFCLIGTVGSVNMGAIDPLSELADIAAKFGLWLHIDGAFGALAILHPDTAPLVNGVERADSLAFDFHKWMHVNYDAGFVLVRDGEDQRRAFAERPEYLEGATRGLAAGNPWFCDYGPELSRGFRALKVWYQMAHFGLDKIGANIAQNCAQARHLADLINKTHSLELLAPVTLNITCFRVNPGGLSEASLDRLNGDIVITLQESGFAAPSTTRVNGKLAIRVNITNHRTKDADLDLLVFEIMRLADRL